MLGLILLILFIWLGCVGLAVLLDVSPDGNGVLRKFGWVAEPRIAKRAQFNRDAGAERNFTQMS